MTSSHDAQRAGRPADIAIRLQQEVDQILENVDERALFAEFKEDEIVTIQAGERTESVQHILEERISLSLSDRTAKPRFYKTHRFDPRGRPEKKVARIVRLVKYLFKPLHY